MMISIETYKYIHSTTPSNAKQMQIPLVRVPINSPYTGGCSPSRRNEGAMTPIRRGP